MVSGANTTTISNVLFKNANLARSLFHSSKDHSCKLINNVIVALHARQRNESRNQITPCFLLVRRKMNSSPVCKAIHTVEKRSMNISKGHMKSDENSYLKPISCKMLRNDIFPSYKCCHFLRTAFVEKNLRGNPITNSNQKFFRNIPHEDI